MDLSRVQSLLTWSRIHGSSQKRFQVERQALQLMSNGLCSMSEAELFKELGTYERHFNQMQNVCRGFASTWLLAVFGGFGYIIANKTQGILDWKVTGSLVALSGVTGIFLLWVLDVLVYHNLLLAIIDARSGKPKLDFTKQSRIVEGVCVTIHFAQLQVLPPSRMVGQQGASECAVIAP